MKMRIKPLVVDVIEDDGMWLDMSTMTYYDKDSLEPIDKHEADLDDDFVFDEIMSVYDSNDCLPPRDEESLEMLEKLARHFYELGLNTRKEE